MRKTVPKHEMPEAPLPANVVKTLIDDEVGTSWLARESTSLSASNVVEMTHN